MISEAAPAPVEPSLNGNVDLMGLIAMLPLVNDPPRFISAFNKAKVGHGNSMDLNEKGQIILAFVSLLGLSTQQRQQVINKLAPLTQAKTLAAVKDRRAGMAPQKVAGAPTPAQPTPDGNS